MLWRDPTGEISYASRGGPGRTSLTASPVPMKDLRFGDFDGDKLQGWERLNARLTSSFSNAVAADFDGDGRSDIALSNGSNWRYSVDGRSTLKLLREGSGSIKQVLIGRFDGGIRDLVVTFLGGSNLLSIWRGPGSGSAFVQRSEPNMR